ncbi:MAG: hypothetical protein KAS32_25220 [Candidatus Peribacteraceae bacterium]|nr:hypothetical protein [Candidatus Peribacteraceae bacterium]
MVNQTDKSKLLSNVTTHGNKESVIKLLELELEEVKDNLLKHTEMNDVRFSQGKAHILQLYITRLNNTTSK